jgi:ABC-2 type transport system permease protein
MVWVGMTKYSGFQASGDAANQILGQFPKSIQAVLGFEGFDLSTALGFYGVLFVYLAIMATIHATMLGANIIAKEERDKTVEFLLTKPISRSRVILSKMLAGLVNVIAINLVALLSSLWIVSSYDDSIVGEIFLLMTGLLMLQLIYFFIGMMIGAIKRKSKRAATVASSVLMITFMINVAIGLNESLEILKYFTPFRYYFASEILSNGGLDGIYIALSGVIILICVYLTFALYEKRDLTV